MGSHAYFLVTYRPFRPASLNTQCTRCKTILSAILGYLLSMANEDTTELEREDWCYASMECNRYFYTPNVHRQYSVRKEKYELIKLRYHVMQGSQNSIQLQEVQHTKDSCEVRKWFSNPCTETNFDGISCTQISTWSTCSVIIVKTENRFYIKKFKSMCCATI